MRWPPSSPSTCGAGCRSSPSSCSRASCPSRASTTSGGGGRRRLVGPVPPRDAPAAQAGARRGDPVLDHLHVLRLQHRAGAHERRPGQHHPPLRHLCLPDGALGWQPRSGRGDLALPLPDARGHRVRAASLHPEGVSVIVGVRSRGSKIRSAAFGYANLVPYVFFALFPFYYMIVTSLKNDGELYNLKAVPFLIQTGVITDHYRYLFFKTEFFTWMKNSLIISVTATSISLVIAILAVYSLARLRFHGVGSFGTAVFITYLVPPTLLFLPLSQVVSWLGFVDTVWALVVTYPTFLVAFCTWLLMGYFRTVPREVEECALVYGASRMQTLIRILLPVAVDGIVCAALFR